MGKILWSSSRRKQLRSVVYFDLKVQLLSCSIKFWATLNQECVSISFILSTLLPEQYCTSRVKCIFSLSASRSLSDPELPGSYSAANQQKRFQQIAVNYNIAFYYF